jgi:DNA repair photolyase
MFKPIYEPAGRAKEYCDLAINIYNGCNHGCSYCFARKMFERYHPGEDFSRVTVRPEIVEATRKQLSTGKYKDKTIQLCFMCDPYPAEIDTIPTREVIEVIKEAGAHVQILTKGGDRARRDFDLLDSGDSFGITLTCNNNEVQEQCESNAATNDERILILRYANFLQFKTWVSFEPVLDPFGVLKLIDWIPKNVPGTFLKIGKMNYMKNDIDWKAFGLEAEFICKKNGWNYYIKEDLRALMQ